MAGKAAVAGEVAFAVSSEIITPIIAEQIMQGFGISSGSDGIDYDRIRDIVEEVVADQNRKQTMGRLLGQLGGVNKTVGDILTYARADKTSTSDESPNDRQIRELITGLWTPLNNVLAEFEGNYTGESHALLEAYGNASHLKLSLASLQLSRAKIDQQAFEKRLAKAQGKNRKKANTLKRLIRDQKQAVRGHAMIYAAQAAAEMNFVHMLAFNDRAALSKDYIMRNIDSSCRMLGKDGLFRDRANYDPYDRTGGAKNRYGAVRYKLRNTFTRRSSIRISPFPTFKKRGFATVSMQRDALIGKEEYYKYKSTAACSTALKNYTDTALPVAMFYQTEIRFDVRGTFDALKKQQDAARKLSKIYKFKLPKFASSERKANKKLAKSFRK